MKIKQLQRKGKNLYSLTYETGFIFKRVVTRDIFEMNGTFRFCDDNNIISLKSLTLLNLRHHLNGYEPLKINE